MYLNIGNNKTIRIKAIVGIFDMDSSTVSPDTRRFLGRIQKKGGVGAATGEIPKSFVLAEGGKVYLSQFSAASLRGRLRAADITAAKNRGFSSISETT